jgi:hypothetical protein
MAAIIYTSFNDLNIDEPVLAEDDVLVDGNCPLAICCTGCVIGYDTDDGRWHPIVVIRSNDPEDQPVLACEDCAEWLAEALHRGVQYAQ